ncbi:MAG: tetratricopeptide repeat protein [Planctomycetota bacterium]
MNNERGKSDKELFAEALAKEPGERAAFLDEVCGNDQELKNRIQELLDAHDAAAGFLEEPFGGTAPEGMDRVGRFRILRELGRGGQGAVYLAEDEKLHRQVALKVLPSGFDVTPHLLERFKREAEAASRLDHPGICSVHETGELEGLHYIVMRYVEGESLAKKIAAARKDPSRFKGGVFESSASDKDDTGTGKSSSSTGSSSSRQDAVKQSVYCIEKAAMAVHSAHEVGIVHRDIKPGNIMITPDGDPVILDFGLARLEESDGVNLTRSTDMLGTPAYMSPEQIHGDRKRIDRQTDVYSLAASLFECLTLRPPFEAPTREGLYRLILTEAPSDPRGSNPRIPSDLFVILQTALAKNPDHRYKTALDFAQELRRVRQHEPILTRRAGPWLRVWRWSQRNPQLAAALGGIFLVLSLGLIVTAYLLGETRDLFEQSLQATQEKDKLADIPLLAYLEQTEEDLWPALPLKVNDMENWLSEAEGLYSRLEAHQRKLDELREEAAAGNIPVNQRELERQTAFVQRLSGFDVLIEKVRDRLKFASTVRENTLDKYRDEWDETITGIADQEKNPHYDGLKIKAVTGLIPLGRDPHSKLYEFAHLQTGEIPERNSETGQLEINEVTGLVFVLVPGGRFNMGSLPTLKENPSDKSDVYSKADVKELPLHPVTLDPFFLSKYEMTQGQWLSVTGENPAYYCPGSRHVGLETGATLRNPVETVSWNVCDRLLRRLDLVLPMEPQWEYACRAGTDAPWYTGSDKESLEGHENIADGGSKEGFRPGWDCDEWLDDGYVATAPVGSFQPNPFGFHDMAGNVNEWCRNPWVDYLDDIVAGDGERMVKKAKWSSRFRMRRGGHFKADSYAARSALRSEHLSSFSSESVGLRPAMKIDGDTSIEVWKNALAPDQNERIQKLIDQADRFYSLGRFQEAEPLYHRLVENLIDLLGEEHPVTIVYRTDLAWALWQQGKYSEAETLYGQLLENRMDILGAEHPKTLRIKEFLAWCLYKQARYSEAELLFHPVYEGYLLLWGAGLIRTLNALDGLSSAILLQGKYAQAEPFCRKALEALVRESSEENPKTIRPRYCLARTLLFLDRIDESERLFRKNLEISGSLYGEDHIATIATRATIATKIDLAIILLKKNHISEAKALIERVMEICNRTLDEEAENTLYSKSVFAEVLQAEGELTEAEALHASIFETTRRVLGNEHPDTAYYMRKLGLVLMDQEKLSDAETLLSDTVRLADEVLPVESLDRISYHKDYGRCLLAMKRYDEAEAQLRSALEDYRKELGDKHTFTQETLELLIDLYDAWGKPDQAAEYRARK